MVARDILRISLDEFMRRYDETPIEIINGEILPMSPQSTRSARIAGRLFLRLSEYVLNNSLGEAFIEAPFALIQTGDSDWVKGSRTPDVMFIRSERLKQLSEQNPDWEDNPMTIPPDLAVEVISPTDRFTNVNQKIAKYLEDGVQLIWVVDPQAKTVTVYRAGSSQQVLLTRDDTLTGDTIVPDFEIALADLF
jgi:Uma2 family endonuclease